jgi:predicted nucleic acid-binding protein
LADYLLDTRFGRLVGDRLLTDPHVHIPHLASIETASVIRGWVRSGRLDESAAVQALDHLSDLAAERHDHEPFLPRVWELRHNLTAYDALYVALAEALDAPLVTCDARLARAPVPSVTIELISPGGGNAGGGQAGHT